jgi:DNA polymerase-3 subunit gamma/tau
VAIAADRHVDVLEMDAASRTGIDDVRELIEGVRYAPGSARYKVYIVDEVHMLSKQAFNALLKTLEEPPPHVKFLLATTDPQKLPVTVLSRCLKFNLKRLLPEQIAGQMRHIMAAEGLAYEDPAIVELARGADGSLRDGLSLLDQAIAYGGGSLRADDVRAMLGSVERGQVLGVLDALAIGDGAQLLSECDRIASFSPEFGGVLDDLATVLHTIQLIQLVPGYQGEAELDARLPALAAQLTPEDVQLYYQIATAGRRDIALAPDARTGFEMALLRMLAFRPADGGQGESAPRSVAAASPRASVPAASTSPRSAPAAASPPIPASTRSVPSPAPAPIQSAPPPVAPMERAAAPAPAPASISLDARGLPNWDQLIVQAGLRGPLGQLAQNAALRDREGSTLVLALQASHMHLAVEPMVSQMEERISQALGERIRLRFASEERGSSIETPATRAAGLREAAQSAAEEAIEADPLVQSLKREFGARVLPQSIKPV